jgi:hypothetical protein
MKLTNKLTVAIAIIGVFAVANLGTLQAGETSPGQITMKPMQGISFDVGTKHAVSYFLSDNGVCKLTLMVAEAHYGDAVPALTAARFEVGIEAGKTARLDTAQGKSLVFTCQAGSQTMSVKAADQVAVN